MPPWVCVDFASAPNSSPPTKYQANRSPPTGEQQQSAGTIISSSQSHANFGAIIARVSTTNTSSHLPGSPPDHYYFQVQANGQNGLPSPFTVLPSAVTPSNPPATPTLSDTVMGVSYHHLELVERAFCFRVPRSFANQSKFGPATCRQPVFLDRKSICL